MEVLITVLIVIISLLLIVTVLIQNPKGGGLTSSISGGNQMFGAKRTTDVLEKGTWYMVIALVVLSIGLNKMQVTTTGEVIEGTKLKGQGTEAIEAIDVAPEQDAEPILGEEETIPTGESDGDSD